MKSIVFALAALASAANAGAQEYGRVLSSTPVVGQVAVPEQFCDQQSIIVPGRSSGSGTALGAVTGAVIGTGVVHGGGRGASAVIGLVGGAASRAPMALAEPMAIAEPIRIAPAITTIQTSIDYVPFIVPVPVRVAPLVIAVPVVGWGYAPRQHRYPYGAIQAHPRGAGHGQRSHLR